MDLQQMIYQEIVNLAKEEKLEEVKTILDGLGTEAKLEAIRLLLDGTLDVKLMGGHYGNSIDKQGHKYRNSNYPSRCCRQVLVYHIHELAGFWFCRSRIGQPGLYSKRWDRYYLPKRHPRRRS